MVAVSTALLLMQSIRNSPQKEVGPVRSPPFLWMLPPYLPYPLQNIKDVKPCVPGDEIFKGTQGTGRHQLSPGGGS